MNSGGDLYNTHICTGTRLDWLWRDDPRK